MVVLFAVGGTSFRCVSDATWKPGDAPKMSPGDVPRMSPVDHVPLFWRHLFLES